MSVVNCHSRHEITSIAIHYFADTYFGGEAIPVDIPQSYTCPLCNTCGFTQALLEEHVNSEHIGCGSGEIVCFWSSASL